VCPTEGVEGFRFCYAFTLDTQDCVGLGGRTRRGGHGSGERSRSVGNVRRQCEGLGLQKGSKNKSSWSNDSRKQIASAR
jgi:hypothetical protein